MKDVILDVERIKLTHVGIGQVCLNLSRALLELNENLDMGFYGSNLEVHRASRLHRIFPSLLPDSKIWHAVYDRSCYFPRSAKHVLTLHDLNALEIHKSVTFKNRLLRRLDARIEHAKREGHIVFISNFAKKQALHYFDIPEERMSVVYNGVAPCRRIAKPSFPVPEEYFLTISVVAERKNFHTLIDLMELRAESLIIVGRTRTEHLHRERPYATLIRKRIREKKLEDRVFLVDTVSEAEKFYLIENCKAFVFPSLWEGFGIPPIESMAKGKPTFVSPMTSLPEVCGDHAYYFSSFDPQEMADVIEKGLKDFNVSKARKMIEWSRQYSWETAAESYLKIYNSLID